MLQPGFEFTQRTYHPPKDPFNALLSFGYSLLCSNVLSFLLAEGINPRLGNLHGAERPQAYLSFDLMEEFRSVIVDTLVIQAINQNVIRPTDFNWPQEGGGIYLNESAKRIFLKAFETRMSQLTTHPDLKTQVSYRRVIHLQIRRYAQSIRHNVPYEAFRRN
jgi:CRISP-associated protein Cas1